MDDGRKHVLTTRTTSTSTTTTTVVVLLLGYKEASFTYRVHTTGCATSYDAVWLPAKRVVGLRVLKYVGSMPTGKTFFSQLYFCGF